LALFLAVMLIKQSITTQPISISTTTNLKTSILLPDSLPLTFMADPLSVGRRGLEISPDGKLIVYVHMKPGRISRLYTRAINDYNITALPGTDGAFSPIFSPDSKWIAFFSKDKLMKISVDGGVIETLTQTANPQDGIWAEDDRITWIANDGSSLNSINSKGKEYKSISTTRLSSRPARISADEFLTSNAYGIFLTSFSKGAGKQVLSGGHSASFYKDELIFIKGNDLLSVGFDRSKLEVIGTPNLIEKNTSTGFYGQFSISMEGTLAFVRGPHLSRGQLTWRNIKREKQSVNLEPTIFGTFSISTNGKDLAILLSDTQGDARTYNLEAP